MTTLNESSNFLTDARLMTLRKCLFTVGLIAFSLTTPNFVVGQNVENSVAKADTSRVQSAVSPEIPAALPGPTHSPRRALARSAMFPGWGQVMNRQYVKLPFIYAALGGLIYNSFVKHDDYILYREAFQYKAFQERVDAGLLENNPKIGFKSSYDKISAEFGAISSRPLENQRNNFRRSRDLSLIGVGLVYSLAMLDAYVSAHLLDFDVGDNLSFQAMPQPGGFRLSARIHVGIQ